MSNIFLRIHGNGTECVSSWNKTTVIDLIEHLKDRDGLDTNDFYILCQGKLACANDALKNGNVYHVCPRLPGGKGGFGSMLRAIGAQIEKTTSREACRDLSGRRMRDVNNEKKLREWVAKQADREREKEERRRERLERRRAEPRHNFDDPKYYEQKQQVAESLEDALETGLQRAAVAGPSGASSTVTSSRKRKGKAETTSSSKMAREWLGVDGLSDLSSGSDDDSESQSDPDDQSSSQGALRGASASPSSSTATSDDSQHNIGNGMDRLAHESNMEMELSEGNQGSSGGKKSDTSVPLMSKNSNKEAGEQDITNIELAGSPKHGLLAALSAVPADPKVQELPVPEDKYSNNLVDIDNKKQETEDDGDLDLSGFNSSEELLLLGGDRLKATLMAMGLKCGGTPSDRAQRLFSVKGLSKDQIDPKLFAKPSKGKKK